jgi:hypothetical protein
MDFGHALGRIRIQLTVSIFPAEVNQNCGTVSDNKAVIIQYWHFVERIQLDEAFIELIQFQ